MNTSSKFRVIFFGLTILLNAFICISLFALLNWPLLAEIPLLTVIFIEIFFLAKLFYSTFIFGQEEYIIQYFAQIKESLFI